MKPGKYRIASAVAQVLKQAVKFAKAAKTFSSGTQTVPAP